MFLEAPVGVRLVRLGSRTVPEEVHGDDLATGVLEKRRPPVADPGAGEGRAEAVEQEDGRLGHGSRLYLDGNAAPGAAGRVGTLPG